MKNKRFKYDIGQTLSKDLIADLAKEIGEDYDFVYDAVMFLYSEVRRCLNDCEHHNVMVNRLGTFSVDRTMLKTELKCYIYKDTTYLEKYGEDSETYKSNKKNLDILLPLMKNVTDERKRYIECCNSKNDYYASKQYKKKD